MVFGSVMSLVFVMIAWAFTQYARVEISWRDRVLSIVRTRWPFRPKVLTFPLDTVREAVLTKSTSRNGSVYGVSLLTGEGEVPLIDEKSSSLSSKNKAVEEISELLRQRDAGGPTRDLNG